MIKSTLTVEEIEARQRQLEQEAREDRRALCNGRLGKSEAIERDVYRQVESRWLEMEALVLKHKNSGLVSQL